MLKSFPCIPLQARVADKLFSVKSIFNSRRNVSRISVKMWDIVFLFISNTRFAETVPLLTRIQKDSRNSPCYIIDTDHLFQLNVSVLKLPLLMLYREPAAPQITSRGLIVSLSLDSLSSLVLAVIFWLSLLFDCPSSSVPHESWKWNIIPFHLSHSWGCSCSNKRQMFLHCTNHCHRQLRSTDRVMPERGGKMQK